MTIAWNPADVNIVPESGWLARGGWFGIPSDANLQVLAIDEPVPDPLASKSNNNNDNTGETCCASHLDFSQLKDAISHAGGQGAAMCGQQLPKIKDAISHTSAQGVAMCGQQLPRIKDACHVVGQLCVDFWGHPDTHRSLGACFSGALQLTAQSCRLSCYACVSSVLYCLPRSSATDSDDSDDCDSNCDSAQPDAENDLDVQIVKDVCEARQQFIDSFVGSRGQDYTPDQLKKILELLNPDKIKDLHAEHIQRLERKAERRSQAQRKKLEKARERITALKADLAAQMQRHEKQLAVKEKEHETKFREMQAREQAKVMEREELLKACQVSLHEAQQVEIDRILSLRREGFIDSAAWGFAVLGVSSQDKASVQQSFRSLMKRWHPDRSQIMSRGKDAPLLQSAEEAAMSGEAVKLLAKAKEACELRLSGCKPPPQPCGVAAVVLNATPGKRRIQLKWSPPANLGKADAARRYIVAIVDPALGRPVKIKVLEPEYREDLGRYTTVEEMTSCDVMEEDMKQFSSFWKQTSLTLQVAAANEMGESAWAATRVLLKLHSTPVTSAATISIAPQGAYVPGLTRVLSPSSAYRNI